MSDLPKDEVIYDCPSVYIDPEHPNYEDEKDRELNLLIEDKKYHNQKKIIYWWFRPYIFDDKDDNEEIDLAPLSKLKDLEILEFVTPDEYDNFGTDAPIYTAPIDYLATSKIENIKELQIIYPSNFKFLNNLPNLEKLFVAHSVIDRDKKEDFIQFQELKNLKTLTLKGNYPWVDIDEKLSHINSNLEEITIISNHKEEKLWINPPEIFNFKY